MSASTHFIEEVRSRVDLASLVGRDARLERRGRLQVACCPFHLEKTPSFTVYPDGHFHCFGCGAHGDAIGYVMQRDGLDFRAALAALAAECGMAPDGEAPDPARRRAAEARRAQRDAEARRRQDRRYAWAARTAAQTEAMGPGSPGEHLVARLYLGIDRAIPYLEPYPDSIRYHPGRNALAAIATDHDGQITGGQFIHLDAEGHKLTDASAVARGHRAAKETFGIIAGSVVHLPARGRPWMYGQIPVRFVAESVEAGCSIWQITGQPTDIVLGVGNLRAGFRRDCANVVCVDDDARGSAAWKQATRAIRAARADGCAVLVVNTWQVRRGDKTDLNDILRQSGPEGPALLRRRLSAVLWPEAPRRKRTPRDEAIREVEEAVASFMRKVGEAHLSDPPTAPLRAAIRAGTGTRKSAAIREHLASAVRKARAAGDNRPAVIFVPRIDLAQEAAELMRAIAPDLDVKVWLGRSQPGMCSDLEAIRAARARMLNAQEHVCDSCIFAAGCAYQEQRRQTADVWFVAHPMLYIRPPKPMSKPLLVWVDESPVDAALIGTAEDDDAPALPLAALRRHDRIAGKPAAADRLSELRSLVAAVLETLPPGALTAASFRRAGLTAAMCRETQKLEWSTKIEPDTDEPFEHADLNLDLGARARFWLSLAALLDNERDAPSGWLRIATDRGGETEIRIRGRRKVHAGWNVPTILTDANLQLDLVRYLWPDMTLLTDVAVDAPHQRIRQVIDRSYSLTQLDAADPKIADPGAGAPNKLRQARKAQRLRRRRALRDVHAKLHRQARIAAPRTLLAVAPKRIVEQITAIGPLPRNVEWLHHGAVSGIDRYRDVRRIVVIGRLAPAPAAVEASREALTGECGTKLPAGQWYQRTDAVHELADGQLIAAERDLHPDPITEMLRRSVTVFDLQQVIGRGRGLWRDADNPLDVLVLTDVPLEMPLQELTTDAAEQVGFEDRQMAALAGIASQCAAHAAKAHPELWANAARAQYARRVLGSCQPAATVAWRYQVAGQGERAWLTYAPPEMPADVVRAFWTDLLGPLAIFERAEMQPKGAWKSQSEETASGNSTYFGDDDLPERPTPFVWRAGSFWRMERPPDG
jgi:hypothetical protein